LLLLLCAGEMMQAALEAGAAQLMENNSYSRNRQLTRCCFFVLLLP
jgi:hypothetical protein